MRTLSASLGFLIVLTALPLAGCNRGHPQAFGMLGSAKQGARLIRHYGCGACHMIPGIAQAEGVVGPPLTNIGRRIYIAGLLRNTPDNMIRWLRNPQAVVPGNAMPVMGLTRQDAKNVAAYLYTLQ
jgi:cytochrome c2